VLLLHQLLLQVVLVLQEHCAAPVHSQTLDLIAAVLQDAALPLLLLHLLEQYHHHVGWLCSFLWQAPVLLQPLMLPLLGLHAKNQAK
jgi:hypothetical protein